MIENRPASYRSATGVAAWMALLLTGALLQGCAEKPPQPAASRLRVFAADLVGGAKICEAPKIAPATGQTADLTVKLANDGGWCGVLASQSGPKPFDVGLLIDRPAHGTVLIHEVGDFTRIDYTPDRGFAGPDSFTVRLVPGDAVLRITATVTSPSAPAQ